MSARMMKQRTSAKMRKQTKVVFKYSFNSHIHLTCLSDFIYKIIKFLIVKAESVEEETQAGASSPADVRQNIRSKYEMDMPDDFYQFWNFAKHLSNESPQGVQFILSMDKMVMPCETR